MDKNENRRRFERQRRNLMIVSVLLIFYVILDLKLKTINILGNSFSIGDPKNIENFIWLLFTYFLIRYYQFHKVVNNSEFILTYIDSMQKHVSRVAFNIFKKEDMERLVKDNPDGQNFIYRLDNSVIMSQYKWMWNIRISGARTWHIGRGAGSQSFRGLECTVQGKQLIWPKIKSYYAVYVETPHITEYLLPFFLSLVTVGVKVYYS